MRWFTEDAPIRLKMMVVTWSMTCLVAVAVLCAALLPTLYGLAAGAAVAAVTFGLSMRFRKGICDPYVATVVRMEALAAGDLDTPIERTEYKDCVGRMTKAMFTFRDTARAQKESAAEQQMVVSEVSNRLEDLANGNLTASIDIEFSEGYRALKTNFNEAVTNLRDLVSSVIEAVSAIRTGSSEIAQASEDLARRTESNAASLEQTTAAISSIDERLSASAVAAGDTVREADQVISVVGTGRSTAEGAVSAMQRVSESAEGIDSVIEGLDKIAFQTRVLAMNAAVEAGRAGEAGRGFAVVADLVSALAMRAEEEAKLAREQLTITQTEVNSAVHAVESVDTAFTSIVDGVQRVHSLLGQIAEDNKSQSTAISEISEAVNAMDRSTQQNAAMVEETSAAARSLATDVTSLGDQAGRFRIGAGGSARGSLPASISAAPSTASRDVAPMAAFA